LGYTKKEIIRMANDSLSDIENFYKKKFLNYKGVTVDTGNITMKLLQVLCTILGRSFRESGVSPEELHT